LASFVSVFLIVPPDRVASPPGRRTARLQLKTSLGLANYTNNLKRQGLTNDDLAAGGSDRLVDSLVVWGGEAAIVARV
jgi:hypothetical protein